MKTSGFLLLSQASLGLLGLLSLSTTSQAATVRFLDHKVLTQSTPADAVGETASLQLLPSQLKALASLSSLTSGSVADSSESGKKPKFVGASEGNLLASSRNAKALGTPVIGYYPEPSAAGGAFVKVKVPKTYITTYEAETQFVPSAASSSDASSLSEATYESRRGVSAAESAQ